MAHDSGTCVLQNMLLQLQESTISSLSKKINLYNQRDNTATQDLGNNQKQGHEYYQFFLSPFLFMCFLLSFCSLSYFDANAIQQSIDPGFGLFSFNKLPSMVSLALIPNMHRKYSDRLSLGQVLTLDQSTINGGGEVGVFLCSFTKPEHVVTARTMQAK